MTAANGIIYIVETVEDNPVFSLLRSVHPYFDGDPVRSRFTRAALRQALVERNLTIILEDTSGGNILWLLRIFARRFRFLHLLNPIVTFADNQINKVTGKFSSKYHVLARKEEPT